MVGIIVLKSEKVLGGATRPAGFPLASIAPTEPLTLADVDRAIRFVSAGVVAGEEPTRVVLILTRGRVLGGIICAEGHRLAALELAEGTTVEDLRHVLLLGEYDLQDAPPEPVTPAEPVAPVPSDEPTVMETEPEAPSRARRGRSEG
jgi:hypothetical protein